MVQDFRQANVLVELASLVAYHGDAFLRANSGISRSGVDAYWCASRNRLDAWSMAMKKLETTAREIAYGKPDRADHLRAEAWENIKPLIEEILASEVLTRTWAVIGCELDRRNETEDIESFVRSILVGHLEARHRLLRLVFNKLQLTENQLRHVDQIRRRAERWTDVILGYLVSSCQVDEFSFDINRVVDFSQSLQSQQPSGEQTRSLLLVSLRSSFADGFTGKCPNPQCSEKIAEAILASFGSDIMDCTGEYQQLWEARLKQAARDTQGMIDCLAAEHN